ncbi:MAG TPA: hypothetical protein VNL77_11065 [Roseiflexaceae bacterium]|nr:hypothetical protein [Roseiflexaceae bacterium]
MAKAGLLFVGTEDGVVLFSNPGAVGRWLRVGHELRGQVVGVVWARPDNPLLVVAGCGPAGVWRSDDGGQRWAKVLDTPAAAARGGTLVVLAGKEPALLLAAGDDVWRSGDDGANWSRAEADAAFAGGVTVIAPASYHIDTAFAGTGAGQLYQSADRGRTWQLLKDGLPPVRSIAAARLA